ncbi:MAG: hypothetical protein QOH24_855, partial [Verrucomicrobiota bacterium]
QRARRLIAEPQILRQPQHHGLVRDRIRCVDQELDQERQPKLPPRGFENSKFGEESP